MQSFIHFFIVFCLCTAYRNMSSNFLVFHTSGNIKMIFSVSLYIIAGKFPRRLLKCSFHCLGFSSWLVSFALKVLFFYELYLLSAMLVVIDFVLQIFWFYSFGNICILVVLIGMFQLVLTDFFKFSKFVIVRILLKSLDALFVFTLFSLIAFDSQGTLHLAFGLVGMHLAADSISTETKLWYFSFEVYVSDAFQEYHKIKRELLQSVAVLVLIYGCITWTLKQKLDSNYTGMLP